MAQIVASVLNADLSKSAKWLAELEDANIERIQFDLMDGKFVPNTGVPQEGISALRPHTTAFFEAHVMAQKPETYIESLAEKGAQMLIFHLEATQKPLKLISDIEEYGMKVGVAANSKTGAQELFPFLDKVDLCLVMSVDAGFGGQQFQQDAVPKISALRKKVDEEGLDCEIEVDGGINPQTAALCNKAGADLLVIGSFLFKHPKSIKAAAEEIEASLK